MKFHRSDEVLRLGYKVSLQRRALLGCTRRVGSEWFWWKRPAEMGETYCDQPSEVHNFRVNSGWFILTIFEVFSVVGIGLFSHVPTKTIEVFTRDL